MPAHIVIKLNQAINEALNQPEVMKQFSDRGIVPAPGTPHDATKFINEEVEKWSQVVKLGNIRVGE